MSYAQELYFDDNYNFTPNTFIGNVANIIPTKEDLASYMTIDPTRIKNFEVYDNNIRFYVDEDYDFDISGQVFQGVPVTFFIPNKNLGDFSQNSFEYNQVLFAIWSYNIGAIDNFCFHQSALKFIYFPNQTGDHCARYRSYYGISSRVYLPKATKSYTTAASNDPIKYFTGTFYLRPDYDNGNYTTLEVIASRIISFGGNIVKVLDDTLTPNAVNDLEITSPSSTQTQFTFTEIPEADFYEVWVYYPKNKVWILVDEITNSGDTITVIENISDVKIKIATCDQYWNGSGMSEDINRRAFSNETQKPVF